MIKLLKIQECEIERIRKWRNAQVSILRQSAEINKEEQINYFHNHVWPEDNKVNPKQLLSSIYDGEIMIGYGGLTNISWDHLRAEISFLLDPKYTQQKMIFKKYFDEFIKITCHNAFQILMLNRLVGETYAFRQEIIEVLEHNGFKLEGTMRDHVVVDGKFINSFIHGKLRKND